MGDGRFKPGHKKGVPKSKEHRERISLALKKHNANPEVREQKRLRMLGTLNPMAGKHFNHAMDVTKRKGWKGGISYEKEPKEFSKMLKKYIHAVYEGKCCKCNGVTKRMHVHHVDENRMNNDPYNLELWCSPCHLSFHKTINLSREDMKK